MQRIELTYTQLIMIGMGIGLFLGLIPLILGIVKGKRKLALWGFFASIAAGAAWKKFATDYCRKELAERVAGDGMPADLDLSDIAATIANGANWLWDKDKATVMFTVFMNSGMPSMPYDVDIPYAALKPYMKSDAAPLAPDHR